jgi:hypothetical protein
MAQSIDSIIERLETVVAEARAGQSALGYFAALYRRVTIAVKEAIERGEFEDNGRMEALDVHFAGRYLSALEQFQNGQPTSKSWRAAFEQTHNGKLIVLQHLLLGMNAHISLDLGISAAAVADRADPMSLKNDFCAINRMLGSMIDDTQERLTRFFGPLGILDHLLGSADESLSMFSIEYARDKAWTQTLELIAGGASRRETLIAERDRKVAEFSAKLVRPPKFTIRFLLGAVRMLERGDTAWRTGVLDRLETTGAVRP